MADLEFTGGFDISEALGDADQLGEGIRQRIDEALASISLEAFVSTLSDAVAAEFDTPIPIEADASSIPAEIDDALAGTLAVVPVEADTAPAVVEVDSLVDEVSSTSADIEVGADTTQAQESLDELAESSVEAQDGLSGSAAAATTLSSAGTLAGGSVDALAGGVANLATKAGGAGVAIGAGIGLLGGFTLSAVNSLGAVERLDNTMGSLAERVETIRVGNLNTELGELAITTGSSGSGMRNAAADAFLLGDSFGKGRGESANFSAEILALSGRAVALNPRLGETGDVANTLIRALASGREKALLPFALGITAVEINQRAATLALRDGRAEVNQADKAFAGASLAVEKLGGRLKQDIEEGSKNPILQMRSLAKEFSSATTEIAKPLVSPTLEALREAQPAVVAILRPLGQIAAAVLPAFATALSLVAPPLEVVADVIEEIPDDVLTFVAAGLLLNAVLSATATRLTANAVASAEAAAANTALAASQAAATGTGATMSAATLSTGKALAAAAVFALAYVGTTKLLEAVWGDSLNTQFADKLDEISDKTKKLAETTDATLLPKFRALVKEQIEVKEQYNAIAELAGKDPVVIGSKAVEGLVRFKALANESYFTATLLVGAMRNAGENTDLYQGVLDKLAGKQRENADVTGEAERAVTLLTGSYEEQIGVLDIYVGKLDALYDSESAVAHAQDSAEDSLSRLVDARFAGLAAGGQDAALNEDISRALLDAEDSYRRVGEAVRDKALKQYESLGAEEAQKRATYDQIVALSGLASTLAPGDPLRIFLDQYVAKLAEASGVRHATVTADASQAIGEAQRLADAWNVASDAAKGAAALGGGEFINPRTTGDAALDAFLASLEGRAGGGPVEAGQAYLVNENTPRSEVFVPEMSGAIYPQGFGGTKTWTGGGGGEGGFVMNGNVILEQASPNPTREVVRVSRVMRRGAAMAGLG